MNIDSATLNKIILDEPNDNTLNLQSSNLIHIYRPISVKTIQSTYGGRNMDIRTMPNPKYAASPWNNPDYEPDVKNLILKL